MVKSSQTGLLEMMRWGGFLTLSLFLNFYVLSLVSLPVPKIKIDVPEKIRIAFKSLSAPKVSPHSTVMPTAAPRQQKIEAPKKVTTIAEPALPQKNYRPVVHTEISALENVKKAEPRQKEAPPEIPKPRVLRTKPSLAKPVNNPVVKQAPAKVQPRIVDPLVAKAEPDAVKIQRVERTIKKRPSKTPSDSVADNRGTRKSSVIHKAQYRERTPPVYPRRAYELGQQGFVLLHALVTPDGLAKQLKIETSSGHRMLDMAALAAVKKWEFEPNILNGEKIRSWVSVPVRFVIQ